MLYIGIYYTYSPDWLGLDTEFLSEDEVLDATSEKNQFKNSSVIFALTSLVPTLIPYVFTGLFIFERSNPSKTGLLSLYFLFLFLCFGIFFACKKEGNTSQTMERRYTMLKAPVFLMNVSILRQFELTPNMTHKDYIDNFVSDSLEKEICLYVERFFE